ncbi:MAG: hypothetical protein ACK5MH_05460 [Bacteroidales bacterium]|jgi:hypothetical protein|nr:hypothetical protein [Bacteroidales bacterium]MDD3724270.1 hypothetical protein [Bacteroidales bacterium]MDY0053719.1 hypothetical protein [Bacteroidales bacterium]
MKLIKLSVLFLLSLFLTLNSYSQVDSLDNSNVYIDEYELSKGEEDEESLEIELKNKDDEGLISFAQGLLDYINILKEKDSLIYYFVKPIGREEIINRDENPNPLNIERKYELVFHPNSSKPMFVREMVMNENQAWDFSYGSFFDTIGNLVMFIREYNTFYSQCAELAFEHSEYFYNKDFELIKKTYQAYDQNHNPLEIDDCWMDREYYSKYKTIDELLSSVKLNINLFEKETEIQIEE